MRATGPSRPSGSWPSWSLLRSPGVRGRRLRASTGTNSAFEEGLKRKVVRWFLQIFGVIVVAAASVASLLSGVVVAAMLVAWGHDGPLMENEKPILGKAAALLLASSVILGLAGWLYRRFAPEGDNTGRVVPSAADQSQNRSGAVFEIVFFVALATGLWTHVGPGPARIPLVLGWMIAAFTAIHAHIFLHEFGHLFTAWALGFHLRALQVGTGPLLYGSPGAGRFRITWRAWPICGFAGATDPKRKNLRFRQSLFVAGGPFVDAVVLFALYRVITQTCGGLGNAFSHNAGTLVAATLLLRIGAIALTGVVPHTVWIDGRRLRTDGSLLLWTLLAPKGTIGFTGNSSWLDALEWFSPNAEANKPALLPLGSEGGTPSVSFREVQARLRAPLRR